VLIYLRFSSIVSARLTFFEANQMESSFVARFCLALKSKTLYAGLVAATVAGLSGVQAHPIATTGDGFDVVVGGTNPIIATYLGTTAAYSDDLYLVNTNTFVFNNQVGPVNATVDLGTFAVGTVLTFRLHVNNTGFDFFSGAASLNPDNHAHARVESDFGSPGTTLVSFEDLFDGPFDYNDLSFSFSNTVAVDVSNTPVPGALPLFASGLGMVGFAARRRRRKAA
jgi:hypothetical protein